MKFIAEHVRKKQRILHGCFDLHGVLSGVLTVDISAQLKYRVREIEKPDTGAERFSGSVIPDGEALFDEGPGRLVEDDMRSGPPPFEGNGASVSADNRHECVQATTDRRRGSAYGVGVDNTSLKNIPSGLSSKFSSGICEVGLTDCAVSPDDRKCAGVPMVRA